jgi:hypothetical protein
MPALEAAFARLGAATILIDCKLNKIDKLSSIAGDIELI